MDTMGYLRKIGQFGKNPDGSYTRHIFSPEWERAADPAERRSQGHDGTETQLQKDVQRP